MNSLVDLQHHFQTYVLKDRGCGDFDQSVISTSRAKSEERLNVYSHAYRARLSEILGNDFLGLQALLGAERFEELSRNYVERTTSRNYNARWYGQDLPAFLRAASPWDETLALGEMADLDWTIGLSFDAADETSVSESTVATIPPSDWPDMHCRLHGSIRRLFPCSNVAEIRRAVDRGETPPALRNMGVPQPWIVSRQDHVVRYRRLDDDESDALDAVEHGASFTQICEALCAWDAADVVAMRAAILFKAWIQNQWVAELHWPNGAVVR